VSLEPQEVEPVVPSPVRVRDTAWLVLAVAAVLFLLGYAWEILLPIMLAILASYALEPIVLALLRIHVPRAIAAAIVLATATGAVGYGIYSVSDDALAIVEDLPASAKKLRESWSELRGHQGPVQTLTQAVDEIEKTAEAAPGATPTPAPGVTRVQVEEKPFDLKRYLLWGSLGAVGLAGQMVVVVFLAYFLLASGDLYRRKLVKLVGPTLSRKRVTVQILDDITQQIERFLFVNMVTSVLVALASILAFRWIGLERAMFWGLLAGLFNSIPYFGPLIVMCGVAAVAFLQFGTFDKTAQAAVLSLVITGIEGLLLTPYLLGRHLRMNGVAVFVGLLFWGWVWGVWGMLLAMPMMVVLKSICDHVEDLKGLGELLGE
jgi:predicted PurR-regulated permease PerM